MKWKKRKSEKCSAELGDFGLGSVLKVMTAHTKANIKQRVQVAETAWTLDGTTGKQAIIVSSGQTTATDTPAKSTEGTLAPQSLSKATSATSTQQTFQTSTYSALDFLAKLSRMRVKGRVQEHLAERYLRRLLGLPRLKDPKFYSWKTSEGSFLQAMGETLPSSFECWGAWGIYCNGKCLTANITEFHSTGKESSLSDILEQEVSDKYFLSDKMLKCLELHQQRHAEKGNGFGAEVFEVSGDSVVKRKLFSTQLMPDTTKADQKT